jgi:hypothetical protein
VLCFASSDLVGFLGVSGGFRFFPYGAASEFWGFLGVRESRIAVFLGITRFFGVDFFPVAFHPSGYRAAVEKVGRPGESGNTDRH